MSAIAVDQMRDKLIPIDDVYDLVKTTEPLQRDIVDGYSKVSFRADKHWNDAIASTDPTDPVPVFMTVDGVERQMTLEALHTAAKQFKAPAVYVNSLPGALLENILTYHYSEGMGAHTVGMISSEDCVEAFNRPTLEIFSNVAILDQVVHGIRRVYGDTEILADYKINHSLEQTDLRLILPETERQITGTHMNDVPTAGTDTWSAGVHISNSLIGASQTSVEAYMFRWWCTNGMTDTNEEVGTWSRKSNGQDPEDVYEWARDAVNDVLGGMEHKFQEIQKLADLPVAGSITSDVLKEIFATYRVPIAQQDFVRDHLLRAEDLTMYTILAAITEAANLPTVSAKARDKLMRIGGSIPSFALSDDKARIWREGNVADPTAPNPYEFSV